MAKKTAQKKQYPPLSTMILMAILVVIILFSQGVLLLKKQATKNNEAKNTIAESDVFTVKTQGAEKPKAEPSKEVMVEKALLWSEETSFKNCDFLSKFTNETWYGDLRSAYSKNGIGMNERKSTCLSEDKTLLLVLENSGESCNPLTILRYDIASKKLERSSSDIKSEKCLTAPEAFGKREGKVINLKGSGNSENCEWTDRYQYDFISNRVSLEKRTSFCQ